MAVIRPQIETDPSEIEKIGLDYLRSVIPGWEPAEGDLVTWLISAHARMVAEERDVADDVPLEQILRPLGEDVFRIPPRGAAAATVPATVTVRDAAGYTIPGGMEVLVKTAGDDGIPFATIAPVVVPPGGLATRANEIVLQAMPDYEGEIGNGLAPDADVVPIRAYAFVERITLDAVSSGGQDAETDDEYLERLVRELALVSPTPILPTDFAQLALRSPGVARAQALNLVKQLPELIEIHTARSGAITLTDLSSNATIAIPAAATTAIVETAFASAAVTPRYVARAVGGPLGSRSMTITLTGRDAYGPWKLNTASASDVYLTVKQSGGDSTDVPRAVAVAVTDVDGEPLGGEAKAEVRRSLEAVREVNWITSVIDPTYTRVDVAFEAVAWQGEDAELVQSAALDAVRRYLSPAYWGQPPRGEQSDWVDDPVVRYLEVAQVLNGVYGLRHLTSLRIGREGGALGSGDVALDGRAPLPRPGANITGIVREG